MNEERIFKSKVLLKIIDMVKGDNDSMRVVNERFETVKGKDLWESYINNRAAHPIEEVMEKPKKFQFGVIYVLYGGKRAWIYNLK